MNLTSMSTPQLRALREKTGKAIDAHQELFASLTKELQQRKDPVLEAALEAETKAVFQRHRRPTQPRPLWA